MLLSVLPREEQNQLHSCMYGDAEATKQVVSMKYGTFQIRQTRCLTITSKLFYSISRRHPVSHSQHTDDLSRPEASYSKAKGTLQHPYDTLRIHN